MEERLLSCKIAQLIMQKFCVLYIQILQYLGKKSNNKKTHSHTQFTANIYNVN